MASGTADERGLVTQKTLGHYDRISASGAGLVLVEYSHVHPSGRSESHQLGIDSDENIAGLGHLATTIHSHGSLAGIQIVHSGGKTDLERGDWALMGPSPIAVPTKDRTLGQPVPMSTQDIALWIDAFAAAARRAAKAGFDFVELHAAHGYGLNQWLSPITNQRRDAYGGSLQKRARILFEIVDRIKTENPDLLLSVRIPGQDFLPGGLTVIEMQQISTELERRGVDLLNVSSGIGGWKRPSDRTGEGYLLPEARAIQSVVTIPVIGVGGIQSSAFIEQALSERWVALTAIGRALLKAPDVWRQKLVSCTNNL